MRLNSLNKTNVGAFWPSTLTLQPYPHPPERKICKHTPWNSFIRARRKISCYRQQSSSKWTDVKLVLLAFYQIIAAGLSVQVKKSNSGKTSVLPIMDLSNSLNNYLPSFPKMESIIREYASGFQPFSILKSLWLKIALQIMENAHKIINYKLGSGIK